MTRSFFACAALATLLLSTACSSDDDSSSSTPGPAKTFVPDALPNSGAAVYVREKQIDPSRLVLELVGRELVDAYGVAWRLRYDPSVLRLASTEASSAWNEANRIHVAREPRAGLLVGVVGAKGNQNGIDAPDTVLAEISFDRVSQTGTRIDFVVERSAVVHSDGRQASDVAWIGGKLSN